MGINEMITRAVGRFRTSRENLRSRGTLGFPARGTVWKDPRFPLGNARLAGAPHDSVAAHGAHAGGPTFGALAPSRMQMSSGMRGGYVHGRGW